MRELSQHEADKWLQDPENLANRFAGNMELSREDALRLHAERFKDSSGGPPSTPGEGAAAPAGPVEEKSVPPEEVCVSEVLPASAGKLTDAERAELAILATQIGPTEAGALMGVSVDTARRARDGEGKKNSLLKDVVDSTLEKARRTAAEKLDLALEGIDTKGLDPVKATQVAVGLATVVEKIENRGAKKNNGTAIVWRAAGRRSSEYEELEIRVGA